MSDLNKPQLIGGIDSAGNLVPIKVTPDGSIGSAGGSGGGGDASAANQQTEIEKLSSIDEKIPSLGLSSSAQALPVTVAYDDLTISSLSDKVSAVNNSIIQLTSLSFIIPQFQLTSSNGNYTSQISVNNQNTVIIQAQGTFTGSFIYQTGLAVNEFINIETGAITNNISAKGVYIASINNPSISLINSISSGVALVNLQFDRKPLNFLLPIKATSFGTITDTAATTDTGSFSFLAFIKRLLSVKLDVPLSTINNKIAPLGQALSSASTPVVLPAAQITALTPPTTINLGATTVSGSGSAVNDLVISSTDCSNYSFLSLQLTGTWSGIIAFEFSNTNNTNDWIFGNLYSVNSTNPSNNQAVANGIYYGSKQARYFRARIISYTSGTVSGTLNLSSSPTNSAYPIAVLNGVPQVDTELPTAVILSDGISLASSPSVIASPYLWNNTNSNFERARTSGSGRALVDGSGVTQPITGTIASGATDVGNPVKIGGVYNSTAPTFTNGQRGDAQLTVRGELITALEDFVSSNAVITNQDTASTVTVGASNQSIISGNPTANSTAAIAGTGNSSFAVSITGTFTGTLQFERSLDSGNTWTVIAAFAAGTNITSSTTTLGGNFHGNASSCTNIRVRATTAITGNAQVRLILGAGTGTITVGNGIRLFDRVSAAEHTIKAASTLPVATDTALVVSLRDNINRLMPAGSSSNLYTSLGTAVSAVIKNSPGNVYAVINALNTVSSVRYLQFFNSVTVPTNGATPITPGYPIPPNNGYLLLGQDVLGGEGIYFTTGISFGISTTPLTYTAATATDVGLSIRYL